MRSRSNVVVMSGILSITVLEGIAMFTSHNGHFFSASVGAICLLAGVKLKEVLSDK